MSWLLDVANLGDRVQDTDGTQGTIVEIANDYALVSWDDNTQSWREEDFLSLA